MPTWGLAALAVAFVAATWLLALAFTRTHPIEQEDPWQPEQQPSPTHPAPHPPRSSSIS